MGFLGSKRPSIQIFTDYLVRLMKYIEFMKKVVPLHDDLFDFFYEALPGYEEVGRRRILLGCWGSFNNPDVCDYTYEKMTDWGRSMYVTPGVVVDGESMHGGLLGFSGVWGQAAGWLASARSRSGRYPEKWRSGPA